MDHTLGVINYESTNIYRKSLNPCFSGPCSRSLSTSTEENVILVLILVLVDHALGVSNHDAFDGDYNLS